MAFYQCFKTRDRDVYCSSTQFKNHDEGNTWVKACMQNFGIRGDQILHRPYESDDQPDGATIWP